MANFEQNAPMSKRIYVGNLPYQAQPADLEQYLTDAGFTIVRLDMNLDPETGRNPSYCFVELPSEDEAARAINELQGASFMGRPLRVNVHTPKRNGGQGVQSSPQTPRTYRGWGPRSADSPQDSPASARNGDHRSPLGSNRWQRNDASAPRNQPENVEPVKRLYVGGLPSIDDQEVLNETMRDLFNGYEITSVSKLIAPHASAAEMPGSHHYCFVDFPSVEDAQRATALDGATNEWGSTYRVNLAKNKPRRTDREQGHRSTDSPNASAAPIRDFGSSWRRRE
ncbi:hypothetical protein H2203_003705 [Taxawa tesnikishii (nom. ined.)]|nr:hypothetical protein H2203_003705 [Dothideales sp. JES 119]